jgi:hypothetical protein
MIPLAVVTAVHVSEMLGITQALSLDKSPGAQAFQCIIHRTGDADNRSDIEIVEQYLSTTPHSSRYYGVDPPLLEEAGQPPRFVTGIRYYGDILHLLFIDVGNGKLRTSSEMCRNHSVFGRQSDFHSSSPLFSSSEILSLIESNSSRSI